jgi:hypothetical protein
VNDCSPEIRSRAEVAARRVADCRPTSRMGKAEALREGTSASTAGSAGVGVQASRERSAEITSGRASMQQGLTATCKDRRSERRAERGGGSRSGAWARRSDDGGVTLAEVMGDITLGQVTPGPGKGALDTWRSRIGVGHRAGRTNGTGRGCKPVGSGVDASQRLSFLPTGKAPQVYCHAKIRTGLGRPDRPGSQGGLRKRGPWERLNGHEKRKRRNSQAAPYSRARRRSIPTVDLALDPRPSA